MKGGQSGVIGHEALQTLLIQLGMNLSGKDLQSACEEMDPDGEGEIFVDDFIKWWKGRGGEEDSQWDGAMDDDGDDDND
jgi:Ca2+-binding EF-hand superfamily protein